MTDKTQLPWKTINTVLVRLTSILQEMGKKDLTNKVTFVHLVKAMVFPVVMYGCKRWTVKKAEQ